MAEYLCEGCGANVISNLDTVPATQMCAVCNWLNATMGNNPVEMMHVYRRLNPDAASRGSGGRALA